MADLQTQTMDKSSLEWQKTVFKAIERRDEISSIEALLREGDINFRKDDEYSPLLYACKCDRQDVVRLLIDLGSDVNSKDAMKETALYRAAQKGWLEVAKSLVSKGADINFTGPFGQSPVFAASVFNKLDVLQFLLDAGADPNIHTMWHATALHLATKMGRLTVVSMLVKGGADVNSPSDPKGITPLHYTYDPPVAEVLIRAGADVNNVNLEFEKSSFSRFVLYGLGSDLIKLCIEYGAVMNEEDYDTMSKNPELEQGILQNAKLCALLMANRFNNKDLPDLYKLQNRMAETLPNLDKLKIVCGRRSYEELELTAQRDIDAKGHCNVPKARPFVLSMLCIKPLIDYCKAPLKVKSLFRKRWVRQSKRLSSYEVQSPSKSSRFK